MASGLLIFTHILPVILGFLGVLLIISGVMDEQKVLTAVGAILIFIAGISPFIIVPMMIG
ncbi:MAG: hypothetical protein K1X33_04660 [Methanobacteriaceae archaeon]|nr:hypothetical protein [Methanobacteriaceae archaeon]